ncbi:hypothetical protein RKD18_000069 [Streptomyces phaeoluteigriseus]
MYRMARERVLWPVVVDRARQIVVGYAPLKITLRQVMYRLVAEGVLPHTAPMYRRLSAQLAQARREGRHWNAQTIESMIALMPLQSSVPTGWPERADLIFASNLFCAAFLSGSRSAPWRRPVFGSTAFQ